MWSHAKGQKYAPERALRQMSPWLDANPCRSKRLLLLAKASACTSEKKRQRKRYMSQRLSEVNRAIFFHRIPRMFRHGSVLREVSYRWIF